MCAKKDFYPSVKEKQCKKLRTKSQKDPQQDQDQDANKQWGNTDSNTDSDPKTKRHVRQKKHDAARKLTLADVQTNEGIKKTSVISLCEALNLKNKNEKKNKQKKPKPFWQSCFLYAHRDMWEYCCQRWGEGVKITQPLDLTN